MFRIKEANLFVFISKEDFDHNQALIKQLKLKCRSVQIIHTLHKFQTAAIEEKDLLLIFWSLQNDEGLQLCNWIRQTSRKSPVILLTERLSVQERVAGYQAGADHVLIMPVALEELMARMEALLRTKN